MIARSTSALGPRSIASVRGRVTDRVTGAGLAGATVYGAATTSDDRRDGLAEATTGGDGAYQLAVAWSDAGDTTLVLDGRALGYALDKRAIAIVDGESYEVDLALGPGFSVAVEVVDEAGAPIVGAKVTAILNDQAAESCAWPLTPIGRRAERTLTDAEGRIRLDGFSAKLGHAERYVLAVAHPDRAEVLVDRPELRAREGGALALRVRLEHGHAIEGTLTVPPGAAVQAASITAYFQDPSGVQPGCHAIAREAVIDAEGRFRMKGLRAGEHVLRVHHDAALDERRTLEVPQDEPLSIALRSGRRLEGLVLGDGRAPAGGANVSLSWDAGEQQLVTDAEGRFSCASLPIDRPVLVTVTGDTRFELLGACVVEASASPAMVRIDGADRVEVTGQTVDRATGAAVPYAIMIDGEQAGTRARFRVCCETRDGRFAMRLPPGRYQLGVRADESWEERYAGLLDLDLDRGGPRDLVVPLIAVFPVEVRVHDEAGAPVRDAAVEVAARPLWSRHYTGRADEAGSAILDSMLPDAARLRVQAEGYAPVVRDVDFTEGRGPVAIVLSARG